MKIRYNLKHFLDAATHSSVGASSKVWFKMLAANLTKIDLRFLPKVISITLMVVLQAPLRWYERIFIDHKIKGQEVKDPIFILGHYRSGTTFLHYLVSKDDNLAYASTIEAVNPHTFVGNGKFSTFLTKLVLPKKRPMDNLKMSPSLPFEEEYAMSNMGMASLSHGFFFPKRFKEHFSKSVLFKDPEMKKEWKKNFHFFMQKMSYKHKGKTLLMKTPANTARIATILEMYPNAKFLHIYRNPYKVFLSSEGLFETVLPILSFHKVDDKYMESYIFESYKATYKKYLEDKKLLAKNQLSEVAYETFVKNPVGELERMYHELGINDFNKVRPEIEKVLDEYKGYKTNKYKMGPSKKFEIYKKWQFAFDAFGYEKSANLSDGPKPKMEPEKLMFSNLVL